MGNFSGLAVIQLFCLLLACYTCSSAGFSLGNEYFHLLGDNFKNEESYKNEVVNLELKVDRLEAKVEQQESQIASLISKETEMEKQRNLGKAKIEGMPKSCEDLWKIGHTLNGISAVKGNKSIEIVYCDFTKQPNEDGFQKWIGYADIKSAPVHFYVQRNHSFTSTKTPISYHLARVNEGHAMNLQSGKFTAPRPGTYFFSFTGLASYPSSEGTNYVDVTFNLNGDAVGKAWVHEADVTYYDDNPMSLQLTLNLKQNDEIWLEIGSKSERAMLFDDRRHFTHFTGFLLDEEIVASL
ncbi:uncharacterized protein LOC124336383 [Daphnia pulicaria]|uniref:uncharacterized protein LOC124336383 n=1 Tax=Daphnia pulicaria TaxID=35523 RepID=UPI001EEC4DEA|nr:uncharacterized protein LOC124336383 [Daphnia pulicaria]